MITLREEKGTQLTHQEMDENFKSVMGGHNFLHIQDQKPQGTSGGTFTAGAWRTRDLNTVLANTITGASLSANQITLPAGKYYAEAGSPAKDVNRHQARLYNISDSIEEITGASCQSYRATGSSTMVSISTVFGVINISEEKIFELQHQGQITKADYGFGFAANITTEVYSDIRIWRIGEYVAP